MKKFFITLILLFSTFLSAQTHILSPGSSGTTISFGHDQNVDFFGDTEETYGDIIGANAPSVTDFGPEGTGKYSQEFIDDVLSEFDNI